MHLFYHGLARTYTHTVWCCQTASLATNVVAKTSLFLEHPPFNIFVAASVFENTRRLVFGSFWVFCSVA